MKNIVCIIVGNIVLALGITMFVIPNGLIAGGTTGIGLTVQHFLGLEYSVTVAIVNVVTFTAGFLILGRKFALTTLISTVIFPFLLDFFKRFEILSHLTSDTLLAAIYAGLLMGIGVGLVLRVGASTGGMDIPAIILNKKKGLPLALVMYVCDTVILLAQALFSNPEQILYGIMVVILTSLVINKVVLYGTNEYQVFIISQEYDKISACIQKEIDRGTTFVEIQTGYQKLGQKAVLSVVSNRELGELNRRVLELDPKAFMIINNVNQVRGRGFTLER